MSPSRFAFVLVEPLYPGNVGAAARALKNNGFSGLRLVNAPALDGEARKMAWKSLDVLRAAKRARSLDAAIADCGLVAGFTVRARRNDRPLLALDDALAPIVAAARRGRVALLFGREDRGLTRDELAACQVLVRIDASRQRQVYNLAQAVLLAAYGLRRTLEAGPAPSTVRRGAVASPATPKLASGARAHLRSKVRDALLALGYARLADARLVDRIVARSDRLLDRAAPDASDLAMLLGVIRRIEGLARRRAARS